jgi:hypothetical protein
MDILLSTSESLTWCLSLFIVTDAQGFMAPMDGRDGCEDEASEYQICIAQSTAQWTSSNSPFHLVLLVWISACLFCAGLRKRVCSVRNSARPLGVGTGQHADADGEGV